MVVIMKTESFINPVNSGNIEIDKINFKIIYNINLCNKVIILYDYCVNQFIKIKYIN